MRYGGPDVSFAINLSRSSLCTFIFHIFCHTVVVVVLAVADVVICHDKNGFHLHHAELVSLLHAFISFSLQYKFLAVHWIRSDGCEHQPPTIMQISVWEHFWIYTYASHCAAECVPYECRFMQNGEIITINIIIFIVECAHKHTQTQCPLRYHKDKLRVWHTKVPRHPRLSA